MVSLSSGWSGGPGYSSPEHKLTWYSGLGWQAYGWACSSVGAETVSAGPRTLRLTWRPLWTHIPYRHPLCACALSPLPCPNPHLLQDCLFHAPVSMSLPPTPVRSLHAFVPIPCPLPFTNACLVPTVLNARFKHVPKSCAFVSRPRTKAAPACAPYRPKRNLPPALITHVLSHPWCLWVVSCFPVMISLRPHA